MKRENRYVVLKISDIEKYVSEEYKDKLITICNSIITGRDKDNKPELNCVVVESDWPMYEATWDEIETWVNSCPDCGGTGRVDNGVGMDQCPCGA